MKNTNNAEIYAAALTCIGVRAPEGFTINSGLTTSEMAANLRHQAKMLTDAADEIEDVKQK